MEKTYEIKVSIVIPIYNARKYLRPCLDSLYGQTLNEIEIIMVNDGSTDDSQEICQEYADMDKRFVLINQKNGGSAAARRAGMLAARGEYIGFVDSDDWTEPDMFEKMYTAANENKADIVFCNCWRDDEKKKIKCKKYIRSGYYNRKQIEKEILSRTLAGLDEKGRTHVIRWANYLRIYKRELIEKYQIYNDPRFRRCQDLQLTFEATLYAQSYVYLGDEYLYHNRVVRGSQSRGYTKDFWYKLRMLIEKLYEDVNKYGDESLKTQMDLCTFFFAIEAFWNENKECEGMSLKDHKANIKKICEDSICEECLKNIPYERLSRTNKMYYNGIKNKNVGMIISANRSGKKAEQRGKVIGKILSITWLKDIYLKLRKK